MALAALAIAGCARTFAGSVVVAGAIGGAAGGGVGALIAPDGVRAERAGVAALTTAAGAALVWTGVALVTGMRFDASPDADDPWAGPFTGVPGYLVVTDALADLPEATRRARAIGETATVVASDLFAGLPPHQFLVVVARYAHRGRAEDQARARHALHPDAHVVDGRTPRAAHARRFRQVRAAMRWSGDPQLHVRTPDGELDTRLDDRAGVSLWVAQDGPIEVTVTPRAGDPAAADPRACVVAGPYRRTLAPRAGDALDLTPGGCAADGRVDGAPGFLVIAGVRDDYAAALALRDRIGGERTAAVIATDRFAGFAPGRFLVIIGRHDRAEEAAAQAAGWRPNLPSTFVQDSGALRGSLRRLVRVRASIAPRVATVHAVTPDGVLDLARPASGDLELWIGSPGDLELTAPVDGCAARAAAAITAASPPVVDLALAPCAR